MFDRSRISRFDQVMLQTTKRVQYLSAPPDVTDLSPDGVWSVVAAVGENLFVVKRNILILIPATDVLKVADLSIEHITSTVEKLYGKREDGKEGNS